MAIRTPSCRNWPQADIEPLSSALVTVAFLAWKKDRGREKEASRICAFVLAPVSSHLTKGSNMQFYGGLMVERRERRQNINSSSPASVFLHIVWTLSKPSLIRHLLVPPALSSCFSVRPSDWSFFYLSCCALVWEEVKDRENYLFLHASFTTQRILCPFENPSHLSHPS